MHDSIHNIWQEYRKANTILSEHIPIFYHFCDNQEDAEICLGLVLSGQKKATASSLAELKLNGDPIPEVGDYAIITNWQGEAKAIICTNRVEIKKFSEVDELFARAEGEGDGTLAWWRQAHYDYYSRVLESTDIQVNDDLEIVCEYFEVVFKY